MLHPGVPRVGASGVNRYMRSGPCAGCAAQGITPSASPWRGRRCRPRPIRSQRGRHGGAESTHAGRNEGAGAG
eukprot:3386605-Prymnesium_polylepis.1